MTDEPQPDGPTRCVEDAIHTTLAQLDEAVALLEGVGDEQRRAAGIALGAARHNCHEALRRLRQPVPTTVRTHVVTVGRTEADRVAGQ